MSSTLLRLLVASPLLMTLAASQVAPLDQESVIRITRPWPVGSTWSGTDTDLAVGSFFDGAVARCTVVVRANRLVLSLKPAQFEHFCHANNFDVGPIATLPSDPGVGDRLLAVLPSGLRILRLDMGGGFVPHGTTTLATWSGAADIQVAVQAATGLPGRYVVGHGTNWVRTAAVDGQDQLIPGATLALPAGQVLSAGLIDWVQGGEPEVAVLHTTGTFVFSFAGAPLAARAQTTTAGKLTRLSDAPDAALVQVVWANGGYVAQTLRPNGTAMTLLSGGILPMTSAPTGLSVMHANDDAYLDLVVSTNESRRWIIPGTVRGPATTPKLPIPIDDVRQSALPANPAPNLTPLVIDDVDHNGTLDFVIAQQATNCLVLITNVRRQVLLLVEQKIDVSLDAQPLVFDSGLGLFTTLATSGFVPTGLDGIGMRLVLPPGASTSQQIEIVVHETVMAPGGPQPTDESDATPVARYRYPWTVAGSNPHHVDLLLPILAPSALPGHPFPRRFTLDISLSTLAGASVVSTSPSLLLDCAVFPTSQSLPEGNPMLDPSSISVWYFEDAMFESAIWNGGGTPPNGGPNGNRFIGWMAPMKAKKLTNAPPALPPPQILTNAVAH